MNQNERMVWAATYAAEYVRQHAQGSRIHIVTCVDLAWGAIQSMREIQAEIREDFGVNDEITLMLEEMLGHD